MAYTFDVARHEASPPLQSEGIVLVADYDRAGFATLRGSFQVPLEPFGKPGHPLQRHIVLVAKLHDEHRPFAMKPFARHVLLDGDDQRRGGTASGWFNVSMHELLGEREQLGDWLCMATLGPFSSGLIRVRVSALSRA